MSVYLHPCESLCLSACLHVCPSDELMHICLSASVSHPAFFSRTACLTHSSCMSVYLYTRESVFLSISIGACLSVYLHSCLHRLVRLISFTACLTFYLYVCLSVCLWVCISKYQCVCMSVCLHACLHQLVFVYLYVCMYVYLRVYFFRYFSVYLPLSHL